MFGDTVSTNTFSVYLRSFSVIVKLFVLLPTVMLNVAFLSIV